MSKLPTLTTQEIEMFSKATDIQEMWQPKVGDTIYNLLGDDVEVVTSTFIRDGMLCIIAANYKYIATSDRIRWIPSQEQMWGMVADRPSPGTLMDFLVVECGWNGQAYGVEWIRLITLRALMLEYVMKEKFGKFWNGTDWDAVR